MKHNAFGAELDRNGYAPSILQQGERCHMCHENPTFDQLDRHEVFGGAYREKSKELGLWVLLCHHEHHIFGRDAVHNNRAKDLELKQEGQRAAMAAYGWNTEEFIARFGRNYLEDE